MSDSLDFNTALQFSRSLKSIDGFSYDEAVILATAGDLMRWCTGAIIERKVWSAEDQASWLVTEAREKWEKWAGTSALHKLFRAKFEPARELPPERKPFDMGEKPPIACQTCKDSGMIGPRYCDTCILGREMKAMWGRNGLTEVARAKKMPEPPTRSSRPPVTKEDIARAELDYQDRKARGEKFQ